MTQRTTGDTQTGDRSTGESIRESAQTEARRLSEETKSQARSAYTEVGERMRHEADSQSRRAAEGLRDLSHELDTMASSADGTASSWVKEGSTRIASFADRLELEGLDGITSEVKAYARRRPGMFLAAAFGAGLVISRVVKNADMGSITSTESTTATTGTRPTNGGEWGGQRTANDPEVVPNPFVDPGGVR